MLLGAFVKKLSMTPIMKFYAATVTSISYTFMVCSGLTTYGQPDAACTW